MAAWAGSADLSPIDQTAYPWIALGVGIVMLVVWIVLLTRLRRIPVTPRQRRFDYGQMSTSEKGWILVLIVFVSGLIAWLNAAATVDWSPMGAALATGKPGPLLFAAGLAVYVIVMVVGIWISVRKVRNAFRRRAAAARNPA
jgi:peptidoglycan biosynthesis protein MviN/MurJ (putative lipid II flippase)